MTDAAPFNEEAPADSLLGRAQHLIGWLVDLARQSVLDGPLSLAASRSLVREVIMPAEAALRRVIVLIAATLPLPRLVPVSVPGRPAPVRPPGPDGTEPRVPRPPRFRLNEPAPRAATGYLPATLCPRISIAGFAPPPAPPAPRATPDVDAAETRLLRRLYALERAALNPEAEARRLVRLRARNATLPRLSRAAIPGLDQPYLSGEGAAVLADLALAASAVLAETPDSS